MEKQKNNRKSYSKRWYRDNAKTLKEKRNKKLSEMTDEERNSLKQKQKKYYIDNSQMFRYVKNTWYRYMHGYFGEIKVSEITEAHCT